MKKLILLIILSLLISCSDESGPNYRAHSRLIVPDSLKEKHSEMIIKILESIKVNNRHENEDMDDWIEQAERTATNIYAKDVVGIKVNSANFHFIPYYDCNDKHKTYIDSVLNR